jgi:hypothetical protein
MAKAAPLAPSAPLLPCPKWIQHPSSKVVDPVNITDTKLCSHKDAINARQMAEAAEAIIGSDMTRLTSEILDQSSPQTAPTTVISSPEPQPPTTAKYANPTTEANSDSDNDYETVRHCTLHFV